MSLAIDNFNLPGFVKQLDALPRCGRYSVIKDILADLSSTRLRCVTRSLAERFDGRITRVRLPGSVSSFVKNDVVRIYNETFTHPGTFYTTDNDIFIKDFCIASQRMIPVGAQIMHETGISRRSVLRARGREAANAVLFFLRNKGFSPLYEIHTHYPALSEFSEDGWRRCYLRIADVLTVNPEIKGVFGSSWFFDPVVATVSPRLAYLREIPVHHGALSIRLGSDESSIALATKTSETRRKLFASGRYLPISYLLVWDRRSLLRWAAAQRA